VIPDRPRAEKRQNSLVNATLIASLEGRAKDVIKISTGVATANLAKANVIGGISTKANLMKMNEAAHVKTTTLANASEMSVLFAVVCLPILYLYLSRPET
jgi:hypothetical protein